MNTALAPVLGGTAAAVPAATAEPPASSAAARASGSSLGLALARRRHKGRFSRAAVVWAVVIYAVSQVAIGVAISRWHPRIPERLPDQVWHKKRKRFFQVAKAGPGRPVVVMFGSSRTEGAFQARRLDGLPAGNGKPILAYNFGVPASGPMRELLFLEEMLDAGIRPRLLLVEFLPPFLNQRQRGLTSEEGWLLPAELTASQLQRLGPYLHRADRVRRQWLQSRLAPCYTHRADIHKHLRQQLSLEPDGPTRPHDPWGELLQSPPPADWPRRCQIARDMYQESLRRFQLGEGPCRAWHDLLRRCQKEQIPTTLVMMPESTNFRTWYPQRVLVETGRVLDELKTRYGIGVIDATTWVADTDFFDGHHVHQGGARVFTDRLLVELQPILAAEDNATVAAK